MRSNTETPDGRGSDGFSDFLRRLRQRLTELQFYDSQTIEWEQTLRGTRAHVRNPQIGGTSGWFFGSNIELAAAQPYPAYQAQQVINIQPSADIVVNGIVDLANPTGPAITSCPGFWVATQPVPAQTTVSGVPCWNLPQFPYPNPNNLDDPLNFWIYLGTTSC